MNDDDKLEQFIELAKRVFTRMHYENSFPWEVDPEESSKSHKAANAGKSDPKKIRAG